MPKLATLGFLSGVASLLVAACGSSSSESSTQSISSASSSAQVTPSPTASPSAAQSATVPATPSPAPAAAATVTTASATVDGKPTTVLTNAVTGRTLYYRTSDTPTKSTCTSADHCATNWPPLMAPASGSPTSATPLPGGLSVVDGGNGKQVAYKGHLLYAFAGDMAPGQANGQGLGHVWFVVTPGVAPA